MILVRRLWRNCTGVCVTFLVTLAIFPGLAADIKSYHNPFDEPCPVTGRLYGFGVWQSFLFLVFNAGDTVGRQLTLLGSIFPRRKVWIIACFRIVFIPLFMTTNLRRADGTIGDNSTTSNSSSPSAAVVGNGSDFWPCFLMGLMAVSNGYCAGLEMMNGPKECTSKADQSRAGTILAFFMTLGLLLGALLAFPVSAMI